MSRASWTLVDGSAKNVVVTPSEPASPLPDNQRGPRFTIRSGLITNPVKGPYYAKEFTLAQTHLRGSRFTDLIMLLETTVIPPPWWNPLPDAIRKWDIFNSEGKWTYSTSRKWPIKVRDNA